MRGRSEGLNSTNRQKRSSPYPFLVEQLLQAVSKRVPAELVGHPIAIAFLHELLFEAWETGLHARMGFSPPGARATLKNNLRSLPEAVPRSFNTHPQE